MEIMHGDSVFQVEPGAPPNYSANNPFVKLLGLLERVELAASRGAYLAASLPPVGENANELADGPSIELK